MSDERAMQVAAVGGAVFGAALIYVLITLPPHAVGYPIAAVVVLAAWANLVLERRRARRARHRA